MLKKIHPLTPLKLFALFFFATLLFSCAKEDDPVDYIKNGENVQVTYAPIESEVLNLINAHRIGLGLKALQTLNIVSNVAGSHTTYMIQVGQVNHDNFDKRVQTLMNEASAITVGENVAYGYRTADHVVQGWLNSDEHRKIIEKSDFTHFGISMKTSADNINYFTTIFIKK